MPETTDTWANVPEAPPDRCVLAPVHPLTHSILAIAADFQRDTSEKKANLGVGAYRDENGKPWVLPAVHQAEEKLLRDPNANHEYLPMEGYHPFTRAAAEFLFGADAKALKEGRVVSNQTLSGSGACHVAAVFLGRFYPFPGGKKQIYVSDPTWPNHYGIFGGAGLDLVKYRYYDAKTRSLDFSGMTDALRAVPDRSVVVLHACAHNPTGVDPSKEQWRELLKLFQEKNLFAFFDCAYQGFASGDPEQDAFSLRLFEESGVNMVVCQSFAKNAGLYGERVGAVHFIVARPAEGASVRSQVNTINRSEFSTPPAYGARLVHLILTDPQLRAQWFRDVKTMAGRIIDMRERLYDLLVNKYKTPGSWEHIKDQTGMFSYLGLDEVQCQRLMDDGHIYLTKTSRVSMAGFNKSNVDYIASWIDKVVRGGSTRL
ncbi:aspartate transaminase [Malassezia sp. CBS 17886]|nr:aspartate transaminase [Malassezia sp. CBS 17886]